jgi:hypothetical protein
MNEIKFFFPEDLYLMQFIKNSIKAKEFKSNLIIDFNKNLIEKFNSESGSTKK